VYITN